ncbi:MAG: hypothetical protein ACFB4J_12860 [Elainellaceae cyanobacterium]
MKRLITIALFVLPLAAFTAPALALEDRFDEEFYDGLGNKLEDRFDEEFYDGLGNK